MAGIGDSDLPELEILSHWDYAGGMKQRLRKLGIAAAMTFPAALFAGGAVPIGAAPHGWGAARFGISYDLLSIETPCPPTEQKGKVLICQAFPDQVVHGIHASWYLTFRDNRLIAITFRQNMGVDRNGDPSYGGIGTFPRTVADIERQYGAPAKPVAASRGGRHSAEWTFANGITIYVEQRSSDSPEFIVYSATPIVVHKAPVSAPGRATSATH